MAYRDDAVSGWWYVLGGAALGYALGVLTAPRLQELAEQAQDVEEPGLGKRILQKIPTRVKAAGAIGAARGAGKEAYREAKENLRERMD